MDSKHYRHRAATLRKFASDSTKGFFAAADAADNLATAMEMHDRTVQSSIEGVEGCCVSTSTWALDEAQRKYDAAIVALLPYKLKG